MAFDYGGSAGTVNTFNVKEYGAKGNGTTDDAAAIQAAINAANAVGGGDVAFPTGTYRINTTLQLYQKVNLLGRYRAGEMGGTGLTWGGVSPVGNSQNLINLPNNGTDNYIASCMIEGFNMNGGWTQICSIRGSVRVVLRDLAFQGPTFAGMTTVGGNEEWYAKCLDFAGGQYGMYFTGDAPGGYNFYWDKSYFDTVEFHGQAITGLYLNCWVSNNVTFEGLRIINVSQNGWVLAGGLRDFTIINLNTENGGGYLGTANVPATTGSITSGTTALVVVSATGMVVDATGATLGSRLTVSGAGANGQDLYANITAIAGLNITIDTAAGTTVSGASTTFYIYSVITTATAYFGGGVPHLSIYAGTCSGNYQGGQRYGIDATGFGAGLTLCDVTAGGPPIYDPGGLVNALTNATNIRRPNSFAGQNFPYSSEGGGLESRRSVRTTPLGMDMVYVLRDSIGNSGGALGQFDWRICNPNRNSIMSLNPQLTGTGPLLSLRGVISTFGSALATQPQHAANIGAPTTATSALATGVTHTGTITAAANNDILAAFKASPTFADASKTGVRHYAFYSDSGGLIGLAGGSAPSFALQTGAGTTASAVITGNDNRGTIALTVNGTGIASGNQIQLTFNNPSYNAAPKVQLTFQSTNCWTVQPTVPTETATTFMVAFTVAPTAAQVYTISYAVMG